MLLQLKEKILPLPPNRARKISATTPPPPLNMDPGKFLLLPPPTESIRAKLGLPPPPPNGCWPVRLCVCVCVRVPVRV